MKASDLKPGMVIEFDRGLIAGKVVGVRSETYNDIMGEHAVLKVDVVDLFDPDYPHPLTGTYSVNSEVRVLRSWGVYSVNEATQEMPEESVLSIYRVGNEWWA